MNQNRERNWRIVMTCVEATNKYDHAMDEIWKGSPASNFDVDALIKEMAESKEQLDDVMRNQNRFFI